jgi:hypothetical protein
MTKFALAREHHLHFEKQQFIELEGILPLEQLQLLKSSSDETLELSQKRHPFSAVKNIFEKGRDLWRKCPAVKKVALNKQLAEIAAELTGEKFIRLGYDQFLSAEALQTTSFYLSKPEDVQTLEMISCIQGVVCGMLICLSSHASETTTSIFSTKAGNITYFLPQVNINFAELLKRETQEFLLFVYTGKTSLYTHNEEDPNLHAFKQLGYVFGDRLNDHLNPVLYR